MASSLDQFLRHRGKLPLAALSLALIAAIGAADYYTGYFLSLGIFYVAPIGLLSWYVSKPAGLGSAVLSAVVWFYVNSAFAPSEVSQAVLVWNSGVRFGFFSVISVLAGSLKESFDRQRELARTDSLTGLLNSRAFKEDAARELARARRLGYPVALLYLDLDNFKTLNDSAGHAEGDRLLRMLGPAVRSAVRSTDLVGRVGGDEFAVLLSGANPEHLEAIGMKVQGAFRQDPSPSWSKVSITIGGVWSDGSEGVEALMRRADELMYRGKEAAKGSVVIGR